MSSQMRMFCLRWTMLEQLQPWLEPTGAPPTPPRLSSSSDLLACPCCAQPCSGTCSGTCKLPVWGSIQCMAKLPSHHDLPKDSALNLCHALCSMQ